MSRRVVDSSWMITNRKFAEQRRDETMARTTAAKPLIGRSGYFSLLLLVSLLHHGKLGVEGFAPAPLICRQPLPSLPENDTWRTPAGVTTSSTFLKDSSQWDREIEEKSRERAQGPGGGSMAAGAILGGLLGGPFGALFGASIGSNMGAKSALGRARQEEMDRLGVTQDMLDSAKECGVLLERSNEGLRAVRDSLQTQQSFARRLDRDASELYERAKVAMAESNEEEARKLLMLRQRDQDKLKQVLIQCAEEKKRLEAMESNIKAIESRAMEVDSLLRRTVGAKAILDTAASSSDVGLSLSTADPLLQKFRDLGID